MNGRPPVSCGDRPPAAAGPNTGERVAVVGPIGSGKTVVAARLSDRLAIPHLSLDELYWGPDWRPVDEEAFLDGVRGVLARDRWVAEGVHGGTAADLLWGRAELVVWLDLPRWLCVVRACRRAVSNIRRRRLLWGVNVDSWQRFFGPDSIGLAALRHYRVAQTEIKERLAAAPPVPVLRLRTRREVAAWLASVEITTVAGLAAAERRPAP